MRSSQLLSPTSQCRSAMLTMAILAAGLAGCTTIPVSSLWQLRKFDFEAFDPAALRLALQLPDALALQPPGLRVSVKVTRGSAETSTEHSFWLREGAAQAPAAGLPALAHTAQRWVVLQLDRADVDRVLRMRQQLVASRGESGQGKNTVELNADPQLCVRGAALDPAGKVSAAVRWRDDPGYVILLDGKSVKELKDMVDGPAGALPACTATPASP